MYGVDGTGVVPLQQQLTDLAGAPQLLAFVVNISAKPVEKVTLSFPEPVCQARDMLEEREVGFTFGLEGYSCRILFVK